MTQLETISISSIHILLGTKPSHTPTEVTTSQHSEFIWPALLVRINTSVSNKASARKCHLEGDQLFPIVRLVYPPSASSFTNFHEKNSKTSDLCKFCECISDRHRGKEARSVERGSVVVVVVRVIIIIIIIINCCCFCCM